MATMGVIRFRESVPSASAAFVARSKDPVAMGGRRWRERLIL